MKLDSVSDDDESFEEYVSLLHALHVGMDRWDAENAKRSCWFFLLTTMTACSLSTKVYKNHKPLNIRSIPKQKKSYVFFFKSKRCRL